MAYDGLVNYSIVKELNKTIINGKIDKIFEPNFDEIILGIYSTGTKYALDLVTNSRYYRANLTTNAKTNPSQAPNFCMTLRKHLLGTHITKIYTNNLERIIFIEFEGYNKSKDFSNKKLIVELMGKHSNIILIDDEDMIIDALKHFSLNSGSYRNIFSGEKYELPKSDKLDFMDISDKDEFYRVLENNSKKLNTTNLSTIISNTFTGISKTSVVAFEDELSIDNELNKYNSDTLFEYINKIIHIDTVVAGKEFDNDYSLTLKFDNVPSGENLLVNFFLDDYYTNKESKNTFVTYRDNLLKLILGKLKKLNTRLDAVNEKINDCRDAEKYRLYGELITSNLYKINNEHIEKITLDNYYENNLPITIPLDKSITPSMNAKKFFKKYQKLKNSKEFIEQQKLSITNDINYLESVFYEIEAARNVEDIDEIYSEIRESNINIKKKGKKSNLNKSDKSIYKNSKPDKFGEILKFDIDGFTVLVGKNNKQNDYLTTRLASKDDLWFHVKDFQGSHVILRTENKIPSQETIVKCAELAKKYSKANQTANIMVDYSYVKFVKKPHGSKPGMVTYTNNKSIIVKWSLS